MDTKKLQQDIIDNFLLHVGKAEDELLKEDLDLLKSLALDSAKLYFKKMTTDDDLSQEIDIENASLTNFTLMKYFPMQTIFWKSVERAGTIILNTLIKAAMAAI